MCIKCASVEPTQIELELSPPELLEEEEPTTFQCDCCNTEKDLSDKYEGENPDYDLICEDCHNDSYSYCECCDSVVSNDDIRMIQGDSNAPANTTRRHDHFVCDSCFDAHYCSCDYCSTNVHCSASVGAGNDVVCHSCLEDHYFYCEGCSEYCSNDNYAQDGYCDCCFEPEDEIGFVQRDPLLIFKRVRQGEIPSKSWPETFIGVELEVEAVKSTQGAVVSTALNIMGNDKVFCKEDGSLKCGVEIVSHPHALKAFPFDKLRSLCCELQKQGARSFEPGTCGLHVHVSKEGLKHGGQRLDRVLWKGAALLAPYLMPLSKRIGGRNEGCNDFGYCKFPEIGSLPRKDDRYYAINLTNEKTVEVRFFRGTLHPDSCVNSIKFSYHLVKFLSELSESHLNNLIKSNKGSKLWFSLLNSLPSHLRQWAIGRSKTALIVNQERATSKLPVSKDWLRYQLTEEQERQERCA